MFTLSIYLSTSPSPPGRVGDVQPIEDPPIRIHKLEMASTGFRLNFPNRNPFVALFEDSGSYHPGASGLNNQSFNTQTYSGTLPPDHAFPIYYPIQLLAEVNDVRVQNAPEMEFYLEMGYAFRV